MRSARHRRRTLFTVLLSVLFALAGIAVPQAATAAPAPPARPTHSVTYDGYSFLVDGKRTYLWSGEFHYFRLPSPDLWLDILQKMKAAGFNADVALLRLGLPLAAPGRVRLHRRPRRRQAARHGRSRSGST